MATNGRDDPRPEADEDKDDDATPAEFIDKPENLPGDQDQSDDFGEGQSARPAPDN